ncbi:hypothetical protein L249_2464 [Ophiocordyceps polyrhachis-furcata BCC 54312]|uniref:Uncharacterized protein n=1 Tax=Ophiocordyceps polyrhachis-furcata BCC 54312 TaxID=1330021 RepID=A0A367LS67_9HYPO|nr:hypothetical protein L249_2464 [Ophiocordyceps polyrhachis-furcata BCC 54312]
MGDMAIDDHQPAYQQQQNHKHQACKARRRWFATARVEGLHEASADDADSVTLNTHLSEERARRSDLVFSNLTIRARHFSEYYIKLTIRTDLTRP